MSNLDNSQIHHRLERLSQVEPSKEASDQAMQRVRDTLTSEKAIPKLRLRLAPFVAKMAAAAVLLIGAGFLAGRFSAPKPLDVEALQATIRKELLDEMENRLQSALVSQRESLKQELRQQVGHDMKFFAEQTLTAVGDLTDQRFMEFARMVEAARIKDRQRVAAAFNYMGSRFGDGLVTLAAHTTEQQRDEQN
ncbi:hypothetical protein ACFL5Z_18675 [Planctomycetota bacterium]